MRIAVLAIAAATLAACGGGVETERRYPQELPQGKRDPLGNQDPGVGIFGEGGLLSFNFGGDQTGGGGGIGVNAFLWRASLDTLAFAPLASADPFGGVIISDWYADPAVPDERFKMTVYILDARLRADGIKVSVFRQERAPETGAWQDAAVAPGTAVQIENAILIRARQLRVDMLAAAQ